MTAPHRLRVLVVEQAQTRDQIAHRRREADCSGRADLNSCIALDLVDQPEQFAGRRVNPSEVVDRGGVAPLRVLEQHLAVPEDRVERDSELVANRGRKRLDVEVGRLDLRVVEQIVDEGDIIAPPMWMRSRSPAISSPTWSLKQHLAVADDGVERRPQLVPKGRQQCRTLRLVVVDRLLIVSVTQSLYRSGGIDETADLREEVVGLRTLLTICSRHPAGARAPRAQVLGGHHHDRDSRHVGSRRSASRNSKPSISGIIRSSRIRSGGARAIALERRRARSPPRRPSSPPSPARGA